MNIESLSYLASALMHAHHNVTSTLGRVVSGSQSHEYNERVVREAIRDVYARSEVVLAELLGCQLQYETTVMVFGDELPAVAYYERDQDCAIMVVLVVGNRRQFITEHHNGCIMPQHAAKQLSPHNL